MLKYRKCIFILVILFLLIILFFLYKLICFNSTYLPTYFSYSEAEKMSLKKLHSSQEITTDKLQKWDNIVFDLIKTNKLGDAPASRVYAYLYIAQHDAAFLSMDIKHSFMGNIDVISAQTLCLFFKKQCSDLESQAHKSTDVYSQALANMVLTKIKSRMEVDKRNTHSYPEKSADHFWAGTRPYFGQDVGSWMPWRITAVKKFVASPPPAYNSPEWQHQLQLTKNALVNVTINQKKAVVFWAGNPGTVTPPGLWLVIANTYIFSHDMPLYKILLVRAVLAMSMADAVIAVFNSKYTYWMKRPFMLDPSIVTIMPTPNHPSYPAGHSTISAAAATVLTYYFPENDKEWQQKAYEASFGRVWGGIHFTIDADQGKMLGKRVGEAAIIPLKD